METRTYKEWQELGYQVQKGVKSESKNKDGVALFTISQVKLKGSYYCYGNNDGEYEFDDYDYSYF